MSEFTGYGRTNHIDFGDYVKYPYGHTGELHICKVIGSLRSNAYCQPPIMYNTKPTLHDEVVPILNIIHCGLDETEVIRVLESDCIKVNNY